ncbi:hypothetical protein [Endozoicomonas atrinae]|uniref:hypothetical protein n=1 Tax=Endozoicomonas atrinae TaxID=1333660 RepID=UPI003B007078
MKRWQNNIPEYLISPLTTGFRKISIGVVKDSPIVTRGDLREFRQSHPYLHLHHVDINRIPVVSNMTRRDVLDMSRQKLSSLLN